MHDELYDSFCQCHRTKHYLNWFKLPPNLFRFPSEMCRAHASVVSWHAKRESRTKISIITWTDWSRELPASWQNGRSPAGGEKRACVAQWICFGFLDSESQNYKFLTVPFHKYCHIRSCLSKRSTFVLTNIELKLIEYWVLVGEVRWTWEFHRSGPWSRSRVGVGLSV